MAYALVISLKQTLEPLLDSSPFRLQIPESEVRLIHNDLCYLKSFFDKMKSLKDSNSVEEVEKEIKDVVQIAQDLIESHLSDLVLHSGSEISIEELVEKVVEVKAKLGSSINLLKAKEDQLTGGKQSPAPPDDRVSSNFVSGRYNLTVGLEDEVMEVRRRIHRVESGVLVICITGIAGIGKTTLVRKVLEDPDTIYRFRFPLHMFVTVGLEYQLKEILLTLLRQLASADMNEGTVNELGVMLHRYLYNSRYVIVLDDIRDTRVARELLQFIPDENNGSIFILTTRTTDVARRLSSKKNILLKRFLTNAESRELLYRMSFPEMDECPPDLETIGKKIAERLLGVPLAVIEIGQLLSCSPATAENWKAVDRYVSQHVEETIIPKALKQSYTELPHHLKACFLYVGVFPPNSTIPTSQLFKLWAAEGFINLGPNENESLEEKAEEYLEDLVSRRLVEVHERGSRGGIKSCRVPLPLQYLCMHEAREEKLFQLVKEWNGYIPQGVEEQRRLGVHNNILLGFKKVRNLMRSATDARSLLCLGSQHQLPLQLHLEFRRLRVLHALLIRFGEFPYAAATLVRLKYLAITCDGELLSSISRLWNLEILIINRSRRVHPSAILPLEIWKLRKLRHLYCMGFDLPDPRYAEMADSLFLDKLLTLSGVSASSCTDGILSRMPRLIKIRIWFETTCQAVESFCVHDNSILFHFGSLESFKCIVMDPGFRPSKAASSLTSFPFGLRKLSLDGCGFSWELMYGIASLPMLQVLKLRRFAFYGPRWTTVYRDFEHLKYLLLEDLGVEYLETDSSHFPVLEQLLIKRCYKLREIPPEFGKIRTLRLIEVEDCNSSVHESARMIQEEAEDMGNEDLRVVITCSWDP